MWLGRQLASNLPTPAVPPPPKCSECIGHPWTRALSRTHRQVLPGLPMSASAWMLSCVFCAPCDGIPWLQAASAFGLLSARIPPPGRSNSVERPPLPKPPGLPGVDLLLGGPRPRRARRRVCAPLHAGFFTLSPQSVFPMRWPAVVVGSRDRRGQAGFAPHFSGRLGGLLGCTSRPGRSSTACTPLIKQVLVPW